MAKRVIIKLKKENKRPPDKVMFNREFKNGKLRTNDVNMSQACSANYLYTDKLWQ